MTAQPYWLLLPGWMLQLYKGSRNQWSSGDRRFLRDVLRAQYCLFLFIRMQDDLFDGQSRSFDRIYISDQYLWEAEAIFSRHFPKNPAFWELYRESMQSTTRAVLRADSLQKSVRYRRSLLLSYYGEVDGVFRVGSFAVALGCRRKKACTAIRNFVREAAMGNQILDDINDIREDLERGRFNYAARTLLPPTMKTGKITGPHILRATNNLIFSPRGAALVDEAGGHFENAADALRALGVPEERMFSEGYRIKLEKIKQTIHRRAVKHLFGR